jgi:hypothetical protein
MDRLISFLGKSPEEQTLTSLVDPEVVGAVASDMSANIINQFIPEDWNKGGGAIMRASSLDKPAVLLAWEQFNREAVVQQELTLRTRSYFLSGLVFETLVYYLLTDLGYKVDRQREVRLNLGGDLQISGHVDFVCTCPDTGKVFGVETKEWGDSKHSQVLEKGVTDTRYLTQIAVYRHLLDIPFVFLGNNRDTRELTLYIPDDDILTIAFGEAVRKVLMVLECKQWEDIFYYAAPPVPVPETYQRKPTGRFYVPFSMKDVQHLFYELSYEKTKYSGGGYRWYVQDYLYPSHLYQLKPPMPQPPM